MLILKIRYEINLSNLIFGFSLGTENFQGYRGFLFKVSHAKYLKDDIISRFLLLAEVLEVGVFGVH